MKAIRKIPTDTPSTTRFTPVEAIRLSILFSPIVGFPGQAALVECLPQGRGIDDHVLEDPGTDASIHKGPSPQSLFSNNSTLAASDVPVRYVGQYPSLQNLPGLPPHAQHVRETLLDQSASSFWMCCGNSETCCGEGISGSAGGLSRSATGVLGLIRSCSTARRKRLSPA